MTRVSKDFRGSTYAEFQTAFLELEYVSQDIANNRSTFRYRAYIKSNVSNGAGYTDGGSYRFSGAVSASASGLSWSWDYNSSQTIKAWTSFTVNHRADGTLPSQTVQLYVDADGIGTATLSVSASAPTIPRASKPRLSSSSVNYGNSVTIYTDRASSSFTHTIKATWNGTTETIATNIATSYGWTVPEGWMNRIPNATSTTGTITLETFNGSSKIGSKTVRLTTNVPSSVVPIISTVRATEAVSSIADKFGALIQTKSKLSLSVTRAGVYGSTIKNTQIKANGQTFNSATATTSELRTAGENNIVFTVTDSRGRTTSRVLRRTVLAYSEPEITSFSVMRCDSSGNPDSSGTKVKITYNAKILPLGDKNNKAFSVRYKTSSGAWTTENLDSTAYSVNTSKVLTGTFDNTKSFYFEFFAQDYFATANSSVEHIGTGEITLHQGVNGNRIGIGKYAEFEDVLDIAWKTFLRQSLSLYENSNGSAIIQLRDKGGDLIGTIGKDHRDEFLHYNDFTKKGINFYTNGELTWNKNKLLTLTELINSPLNVAETAVDANTTRQFICFTNRNTPGGMWYLIFSFESNESRYQLAFGIGRGEIYAFRQIPLNSPAPAWNVFYQDDHTDIHYLSLNSGYSVPYSSYGQPRAMRKQNGLVLLNGMIKPSVTTGRTEVATLAEGFRPGATIRCLVASSRGADQIEITKDGKISFFPQDLGQSYTWVSLSSVIYTTKH